MSHEMELDGELCASLHAVDLELVEAARQGGCGWCGGPLHRADYPRKPRGIAEELEVFFEKRFALCCGQEGCRRRLLPPSVRFLGRKVYAAIAIVAACLAEVAERHWQKRRRIARWRAWWREVFAASAIWTALRGRLVPDDVGADGLPASIYERVTGPTTSTRVLRFLCLVAWVVPPSTQETGGRGPARRGWCSAKSPE